MSIKINIQKKFYIWLKGEIEKKNQFSKRKGKSKEWGVKIDIKNNIYIYIYIYWRVKLKRIITFTKKPRKKLEIKTMRTKMENIISSIWIEWWNWKPIKIL